MESPWPPPLSLGSLLRLSFGRSPTFGLLRTDVRVRRGGRFTAASGPSRSSSVRWLWQRWRFTTRCQFNITGLPVLDLVLAFAWIVGMTNAFNLLDNIDGLAAGVAAIGGTFYLIVLATAESATAVALAAFVGAMIGFLIYNFRPASIFMGDSGSHFIGSFLAGVSLLSMPGLKTELVSILLVPLLILLVPIFDTFLVTLTRRLAGRRAMVGGRDHSSHRLVRLGATEREAVFLLYCLAAIGGAWR